MSIVHKVRRLETDVTRIVERAAHRLSKSGPREPLEIEHAIVETFVERLEPAGRGRYVFPFNRVQIAIVTASREARARFAAVFESEPTLRERIDTRLGDAGCDTSTLIVTVAYVSQAGPAWDNAQFNVEFFRVPVASAPPLHAAPNVNVTILSGTAEKSDYALALDRINLGRCGEVRDSLNRLVRTNHVAFVDGGAGNHTVSRRHAHVEYVAGSGHYRIWDDRSAQGTSVVRNGRTVAVPAGARGIRLESGDEIVLGEARARIEIG